MISQVLLGILHDLKLVIFMLVLLEVTSLIFKNTGNLASPFPLRNLLLIISIFVS